MISSSKNSPKLRAVILGSGNIGTDLMMKILRSDSLECVALVGRNLSSPGLTKAASMNIPISTDGIEFITRNPDNCDVVFDATSAVNHLEHAPILKKLGKFVVDLTPAKVGPFVVPAVDAKRPAGDELQHGDLWRPGVRARRLGAGPGA